MKSNPFFFSTILIILVATLFISCESEPINEELNLVENEQFDQKFSIEKDKYEVPPNG